jgi:xanthine dehydrogenase accessory factor
MSADVFAAALRLLQSGRGVAIATVIGAHGSTPRHLGARMAVADDGEQWGTIGGGRIEQVAVEAAREVAGGAPPRVVRQHLVRDLAMCCGGSMEITLTPAAPSRHVIEALAAKPHTASTPTARVLVTPIEGEPLSLRAAASGDPALHRPVVADGALLERLGGGERAIVFGFGHVAKSVGPLLAGLGFEVIVCDDDETGSISRQESREAGAASPAWASRVIESFDPIEVERGLGGFSANDYILIVTRDHAVDQQILEKLIGRADLGYLGMIGSRGKVGRFRKRLEAKGLLESDAAKARWASLRAPIGLDIGAETPQEIAVSIAAELVALRRRGAANVGDWRAHRTSEPDRVKSEES